MLPPGSQVALILDLQSKPDASSALSPDRDWLCSILIQGARIGSGAKVWVAGEAGAMHRIRLHLFDERHLRCGDVTVRGYWKHGR